MYLCFPQNFATKNNKKIEKIYNHLTFFVTSLLNLHCFMKILNKFIICKRISALFLFLGLSIGLINIKLVSAYENNDLHYIVHFTKITSLENYSSSYNKPIKKDLEEKAYSFNLVEEIDNLDSYAIPNTSTLTPIITFLSKTINKNKSIELLYPELQVRPPKV